MERERVQLNLKGKVQGVSFRIELRERARALGIGGWAKNERDGSLTVIAEGTRDQLIPFVRFCYTGPMDANVEKVHEKWSEAKNEFREFLIQYAT